MRAELAIKERGSTTLNTLQMIAGWYVKSCLVSSPNMAVCLFVGLFVCLFLNVRLELVQHEMILPMLAKQKPLRWRGFGTTVLNGLWFSKGIHFPTWGYVASMISILRLSISICIFPFEHIDHVLLPDSFNGIRVVQFRQNILSHRSCTTFGPTCSTPFALEPLMAATRCKSWRFSTCGTWNLSNYAIFVGKPVVFGYLKFEPRPTFWVINLYATVDIG